MKTIKLNKEEKDYLFRALQYFKKEEEIEISQLKLPSGNPAFISECEKRLEIFKTIINKCKTLENFSDLTKDEHYYFSRVISYYMRAEKKEISLLSRSSQPNNFIDECKNRLKIFKSIMDKFNLSEIALYRNL
jgi:hypothetical protein